MNTKLKLLLIEDKEKADIIRNHLGDFFYKIDYAFTLQEGFDKLKGENENIGGDDYDTIILNIGKPFTIQETTAFLNRVRTEKPGKLNLSFIIFKNAWEETREIEEILTGKKQYAFIDKDENNYSTELYRLEQAIFMLVPRALNLFRGKIEEYESEKKRIEKETGDLSTKINSIEARAGEIDSIKEEQKRLDKNQDKIEDKYVSWPKIIESLGIIVGAFSLAMAIFLSWVMDSSKVGVSIGSHNISFLKLLVCGFIIIALWTCVFYVILKNRFNRMITKELHKKK